MGKDKTETAVVEETAAVIQEEVVKAEVAVTEEVEVQDAEVISGNTFISEEGNEYEFTVSKFLFKGKKYFVADAVANAPEVLEELLKLNSFILKQK